MTEGEKRKEYQAAYYQKHKDKIKDKQKKWRKDNPEKVNAHMDKWKEKNPEKVKSYNKKWAGKNEVHLKEYRKKYRKENAEKLSADERHRRATDPMHHMACKIRKRMWSAMKRQGFSKRKSTGIMLGCSYEHLVNHLESQFTDGMSWDNRGDWHIDHIIPLSSANTIDEMEKLGHYTNLQPLWAEDNLKKGDKW